MRRLGAVVAGLLILMGVMVPMAQRAGAANPFPATTVGVALMVGGEGWWVAGANGSVSPGGSAVSYGSAASLALSRPIVGIAATPSGQGYWLVASDGGIFSFGDAPFFGSTGSIRLNKPIVGAAATSDNAGYWLVASDGGIFSFGDAPFQGSGAGSLTSSVVGMAASGLGYALATVNGVVEAFGAAAVALGIPAGQPTSPPPANAAPAPSTAPSNAPAPGSPSGVAMPTGNLPGWQMVFADDFTGSSLNQAAWGPYSGQPGGDPGGWWDPSHVVVHDGVLELQSYQDPAFGNRWVSGGVSSAPALKQTYGKYEVRFRMDQGVGIAGIALLWPSDGGWPPEIDFAEDGGGNRSQTTATLHYGSGNSQIQYSVSADFSEWHTIGVEWTAGHLAYTLDGAVWATVSNPNVPTGRMEMDLQTQAGTCGDQWDPCPDATTPANVNMQVDWVVAYRPAA